MTGDPLPSGQTRMIDWQQQTLNAEQMAQRALEGASMGWFSIDLENDNIDYSPILSQILTGLEKAIVDRTFLIEHLHPDDLSIRDAAYEIAEATGKLHYEARFIWEDGSVHWVRVMGTYYYDPVGKPYFFYGTVQDITTEMAAQLAIKESQRRILALFEQSPIGIAILGKTELKIQLANPFYCQLVGRSHEELIGRPLLEALPELQGQGFEQLLEAVMATGVSYVANGVAVSIEHNTRLETIYVDLTFPPIREADGTISGVLVVATDVTRQVKSRREIEESEAKFRTLIEQAPIATCLFVGPDMIIELANEAMIDFFGRGNNILGKPIRDVLTNHSDQSALGLLDQVFATGQPFNALAAPAELVIHGVPGTYYFDFSLKPLYNASGEIYAIMETAIDVTQQILAQKALQASESRYRTLAIELEEQVKIRTQQLELTVQDLSRSNQNLEQFAYVASHDLQEPLRKIQQFGDLLRNEYGPQSDLGMDYLQRMQAAAGRMSTLIRDLLSYSRVSIQPETMALVSLTAVVNTSLADLDLLIDETGAVVTVDSLPTVLGDAPQLRQLMQNLFSNALKFRRAGGTPQVRVSCQAIANSDLPVSLKPALQAPVYYRIDVADNGIGFDEKYLDRIFQVFQRLHSRSEFAGTGIGLAICQKVAFNHRGAITATSKPGQGATFSIYLPAQGE